MKYTCFFFLCICIGLNAQTKKNNLLFLRIEKENNLKIDKHQTKLFVIELDSMKIPLKGEMMPVLINDFSDVQLEDCKRGKSFDINDVYTLGDFSAVKQYGEDNFEKIKYNFPNMNYLSNIKIKDLAYSKKIKIYYTVITGDYCVGLQTNNEKIVILSSPLLLDNNYKIPKKDLYDIFKSINFNSFMVD